MEKMEKSELEKGTGGYYSDYFGDSIFLTKAELQKLKAKNYKTDQLAEGVYVLNSPDGGATTMKTIIKELGEENFKGGPQKVSGLMDDTFICINDIT